MNSTKGNIKFAARLKGALHILADETSAFIPQSQRLYTVVPGEGAYRWVKWMDSDGLLIVQFRIRGRAAPKSGRAHRSHVALVFQCEASTSQTKPNPIGKAAVNSARFGLWYDAPNGKRLRIDRACVIFVVPIPKAPAARKRANIAYTNVRNAARTFEDNCVVRIEQRASQQKVADKLLSITRIRRWLGEEPAS